MPARGICILKFGKNFTQFSVFWPHAHPFADVGEIWHGRVDFWFTFHIKILPSLVQVSPLWVKKTLKLPPPARTKYLHFALHTMLPVTKHSWQVKTNSIFSVVFKYVIWVDVQLFFPEHCIFCSLSIPLTSSLHRNLPMWKSTETTICMLVTQPTYFIIFSTSTSCGGDT